MTESIEILTTRCRLLEDDRNKAAAMRVAPRAFPKDNLCSESSSSKVGSSSLETLINLEVLKAVKAFSPEHSSTPPQPQTPAETPLLPTTPSPAISSSHQSNLLMDINDSVKCIIDNQKFLYERIKELTNTINLLAGDKTEASVQATCDASTQTPASVNQRPPPPTSQSSSALPPQPRNPPQAPSPPHVSAYIPQQRRSLLGPPPSTKRSILGNPPAIPRIPRCPKPLSVFFVNQHGYPRKLLPQQKKNYQQRSGRPSNQRHQPQHLPKVARTASSRNLQTPKTVSATATPNTVDVISDILSGILNGVNTTQKDSLIELNDSNNTLDNSLLTNSHGDPKSDDLVSESPPPASANNPLN